MLSFELHSRPGSSTDLGSPSIGSDDPGARATPLLAHGRIQRLRAAIVLVAALVVGCGDDENADCSNGTCVCDRGGDCDFTCDAPPCHVACSGDNEHCEGACGNGECLCGEGSDCSFACHSPPCHVLCEQESECEGTCANGDCVCEEGSSCRFTCAAGPCHVSCAADSVCEGECANGTCLCGAGSSCAFTCVDDNCAAECPNGAACTLTCIEAEPGTQGCRFDVCAAEIETCSDGRSLACGAPCPVAPPSAER